MSKTNKGRIVDVPASEIYGNKVRARVCGICERDEEILLVNHAGLYGHDFWAPPDGGIEFGQPASANLEREFMEETGLNISVGELLFVCEFIRAPLHAIELFFRVEAIGGNLRTGFDPEVKGTEQHITGVAYMSWKYLRTLPETYLHSALSKALSTNGIGGVKGYLKI